MENYKIEAHDIILSSDKKYVFKVQDQKTAPKDILIDNGPESLDVNELLDIVLNSKNKKSAKTILKEYGEKNIISQKNPTNLAKDLKVSLNQACQIIACFELGKRFFKEVKQGPVTLKTAKQVFNYLSDMRNLPKEHFRGLYLNSRYRLIHDEVISIGSLTSSIIHPREVFKPAFEYSAAAIIIAHNHPSGRLNPTREDIKVTEKLTQASEILGIDILDHIIITKNNFKSILE